MTGARPVVRDLARLSQPKGDRLGRLRLDLNERVIGFPNHVMADVMRSLPSDFLAAYPETRPFYGRLARHHGVNADQVLVTAGSEMAIRYIFEAFLGPGDGIVLLDPSFAMFEVYARLCAARVVAVPFDRRLQIRLDDLLSAIDGRTRVVAIANPNNPTGSVFSENALRQIIDKAGSVGAICLLDEAYYYFHPVTVAPLLARYDHLVVTRTFSKALGLASVRLGYALGHPAVIAQVQKLQPIDHASGFAIAFGTYLLDHEEIVWQYAADVREGRAWVAAELSALGFSVVDSAANFVLVEAGDERDALAQWLRDRDVLISTVLRMPFPHQYLRVTVGPIDSMRPFVHAVRAFTTARAGRTA